MNKLYSKRSQRFFSVYYAFFLSFFFFSVSNSSYAQCGGTRTVTDSYHCDNYAGEHSGNNNYVIFLSDSDGKRNFLRTVDLKWEEFSNGTAKLTGRAKSSINNEIYKVDATFKGRTTNRPSGSPYKSDCYTINANGWQYYPELTGTIESTSRNFKFTISRRGASFQLGQGASVVQNVFGASGWFNTSRNDVDKGDFNLRLGNLVENKVANPGKFSPASVIKCTSNSFDPPAIKPSDASCVGSTNPTYRWQVKNEGSGNWSNINGATGAAYNPPAQGIGSKWYRRLASCPCQANIPTTNVYDVHVYNPTPGSISGNQSNCGGYNPSKITSTASPKNGKGTIAYRWQQKIGTGSWTLISGATGATYDPGNITKTTQYRRQAKFSGPQCTDWKTSNVITKTVKAKPEVKTQANIADTGWQFKSNITVCEGTKVGLAAHPTDDATTRWTWTGPNGFTAKTRYFTLSNAIKTSMAGTYTATYKNANGCTGSAQIKVTVNAKPEVKTQADIANTGGQFKSSITVCEGTKVRLGAQPGDDASNRWTWVGPNGFTSKVRHFTLSDAIKTSMAGTYTATYKNASGCTGSAQIKVTVNAIPKVSSISKKDATCGQNNGSITINFPDNSGRSQIAFSLNGGKNYQGAVADNSKTVTYNNLGAAAYEIYARWGDNDCPVKVGSRTISTAGSNVKDAGKFSPASVIKCTSNSFDPPAIKPSDASCVGSENPSYRWQVKNEGSGNWTNINGATGAAYNPPSQGIGSKWYRRLASCPCQANIPTTNVYDVHVYNPNPGSIGGNQSKCGGYNPSNITSTAPAKNGKGTIAYRWQQKIGTGNWTLISGATGATYDPGNITKTTQYRRQAKFSGPQCTDWKTSNVITKTVKAKPDVKTQANIANTGWQFKSNITVCEGTKVGLAAHPTDDATTRWNWTGPNGFTAKARFFTLSNAIKTSMAGTYTATYKNASGCTGSAQIKITVSNITASIAKNNDITCTKPNATLTANPSGQKYKWSNGSTNRTITVNAAGTYKVTVTNASGCSKQVSKAVTANKAVPNASIAKSNDITCVKGNATLTANPAGQKYKWSNGSTNRTITVNAAGTYKVTVTNANGCSKEAAKAVTANKAVPNASIAKSNDITCAKGNATLTANPAGQKYKWSNGSTNRTITVNAAGTYKVTVTSGNGCSKEAAKAVTANKAAPNASIAKSNDITCAKGNATLTANPAGLSYKWSNGSTNRTITVNSAGTYKVVVTGANGCKKEVSKNVTSNKTAPNASINKSNDITCEKGSATLTANPAGLSYKWSNGSTNRTITVGASGTYRVTVTGANGCTKAASKTVSGDESTPNASINKSNDITCEKGSATLTANPAGLSYKWSNGSTNRTITVNAASTFKVTVTGGNGCKASASMNVTENKAQPNASIVKSNDITCEKGSATLTARPAGLSYKWSNGSTNRTITVNSAGTYKVVVTGANGCKKEVSKNVTSNKTAPNASINKSNDITCAKGNATLTANPAGLSYKWSNGSTNRTITVNSAGTYKVVVTGANGCKKEVSKNVTANKTAPNASINKSNDITCAKGNATLTANPAGLSYKWSNGSTNRTITVGASGTYRVTVTGANGCTKAVDKAVSGDDNTPNASINKSNDITCEKQSATLTARPAGLSYKWSNGSTNRTITVSTTGTYSVEVTAANGCTATVDMSVSGGCNPTARVGNEVFNDANNNGFKDNNESGINGVEVKLLATNGNLIATTSTVNGGMYFFNNLESGSYKIMFGTPNGFMASPRTGFGDNDVNNNSDNNPNNGNMTDVFFLSPGESNNTIDAGFFAGTMCDNLTFGGKIGFENTCAGTIESCNSTNAPQIGSCQLPSGGSGTIEYIWLKNEVSCSGPTGSVAQMIANPGAYNWKVIFDSNSPTFNPGTLTTSTCFLRCARRVGCELYLGESNIVQIEVNDCNGGGNTNDGTTETCGNGTSITYGNGSITMSGQTGLEYFFQVLDAGWSEVDNCGWQCGSSRTVNDLAAGEYRIYIKNSDYQVICEKVITLSAGGTDGGNTGGTDGGNTGGTDGGNTGGTDGGNTGGTDGGNTGGTDGGNTGGTDGATETCGSGTSITYGNGTITMSGQTGLEYFFQIVDAGWNEVDNCGWQCGSSRTVNNLAAGEYRIYIKNSDYQVVCEKVITLSAGGTDGGNTGGTDGGNTGGTDGGNTGGTDGGNTGGTDGGNTGGTDGGNTGGTDGGNTGGTTTTCGEFTITYGAGSIEMKGAAGQQYYYKINDLHNNWTQVFHCTWECGHEQTATELSNSKYLITIYNDDWSKHCDTEIEMTNSSYSGGAGSRNAPELNFAAFKAQRTVELQWLTNTGYKNDYFEVEHSTDGQAFTTIQNLTNKEWSDELAYHETTDAQPTTGSNYYRVKQIYLDGSFDYTPIQKVDFNIDLNKINVFPNPAQDELFINLVPYAGKKGNMVLNNQYGQTIQEFNLEAVDQELIKVNTSKMENGLYYLMIKLDNQQIFTEKLMIHRLY